MSFLQKFDFNNKTGYWAVILGSIGISFLIFAAVYVIEGAGWLASKEELFGLNLDIGWNWIRGGGIAFVASLILLGLSAMLLKKNKNLPKPSPLVLKKLDFNGKKGLFGLTSLSVSFSFFFNGIIYRLEAQRWFFGAIYSAESWKFDEASAWITSSTIMTLIGILLSAIGWTLIAIAWKRKDPIKK